ncbi:MAG TPA: hypothetical protein VJB34_05455 [Bdellovibrionota bacterium]|nr:hypothetical protein [Bdellovibrionota bacterium]
MKKATLSVLVFFMISSFALAAERQMLVRVEIMAHHKNIQLQPGQTHLFGAVAFDEQGAFLPDFKPQWKVTDLDGFETTIPGTIDENGFFEAGRAYYGGFKIVALDSETGLFDEALVNVNLPPYGQVARVSVQPQYIASARGMSHFLWVACYDFEDQVLPSCNLNYRVYDVFGVPHYYDVAFITNDSYLHVRPWAPQGQYRIEFRPLNSNAWTDIRLDVY